MKNKSLNAFTLTEMIIVMLLTVVILGMVYTVFQLVSKTYTRFNGRNARINDAERLEEWLRRDFENGSLIYSQGRNVLIRNEIDSTRYQFQDSLIIRDRSRTDTFHITAKGFSASFLDRPADTLYRNPVDHLAFSILVEGEEIPETFSKLYSSEQLIKLTDAIDRHQ